MGCRRVGQWTLLLRARLLLCVLGSDSCSPLSALFSISVLSGLFIFSPVSPLPSDVLNVSIFNSFVLLSLPLHLSTALSPTLSFFIFLIHRPIHSFTYPSLYSIHFFLLQLLYPNSFLLELFPTLTPSRSRLQQLLPTPTPFYGSSLLPRRLSRSLARNQFWQKFRPSPGVVAALCSQPEEARRGPASRGRRK